jgi:hypothetical protein
MCSSCSLQGRFGVRLRCRGFRKGFHLFVANSMGVIPTGTQGLPGRQPRLPRSDRPVFGNIRYMSFASTTTIRFPEIHRPDRKPREARRSHSLRSRGTLIKFLYRNCASGNFGVLYEALLHADKLFTELPASSADIRRSHNVDSN